MKTYKQRCREFGLSWQWNATKGELKDVLSSYHLKTVIYSNKMDHICSICNCNRSDIDNVPMHFDVLAKFVNFRKRLPTFEEVKAIRSHKDFSFWFNKEMNGDDFNSVWVYPSEIHRLYHSL